MGFEDMNSPQADTKSVDRLKKLLALAERGIGGEKITAEKKLMEMLEKHGMRIEDILDDSMGVRDYYIRFSNDMERKLLIQISAAVAGADVDVWNSLKKRMTLIIETTPSNFAEIDLKFEAYKKALKEEIATLYNAFLYKHSLFPDDGVADTSESTMSEEDQNRFINMVMGLKDVSIHHSVDDKGSNHNKKREKP